VILPYIRSHGSSSRTHRRLDIAFCVRGGPASGVVFLAIMGIYGVVWFAVNQRTKEMGIRIALGGTRLNLITEVIRSNARPVISGQFAGLLLAITGSLALAKVSTDDRIFANAVNPLVYVASFMILQVGALSAMLGPAISAVRKDPVAALRQAKK
jgi:putative ABC transport system permease protein